MQTALLLRTPWRGSHPRSSCGWSSSWLETASPIPLRFSLVTLPESPFSFVQVKISQIASSIGDGLARSAQWQRAQMAGHTASAEAAKTINRRKQRICESSLTSYSDTTRKQLNWTIYTHAAMVRWPNETQSTLQWRENITKL